MSRLKDSGRTSAHDGLLRHWTLVKMSSGFGKQETYQKGVILGEGTYAIVYEGKSSLTGNRVALKGKMVRYFIIILEF